MTEKNEIENFEEKHGLQGKGRKVRVSKETKEIVEALSEQSERIIEAGENWTKTTKNTFG